MAQLASSLTSLSYAPKSLSVRAAVLRGLGFVLLCVLLFLLLSFTLGALGVSLHNEGSEEGAKSILNALALCAVAAAATAICAKVEGRSLFAYGLGDRAGGRRFLAGIVIGLLLFGLLIGTIGLTGHIKFTPNNLNLVSAIEWGLFWIAAYFCVALAEETLFRGYLLATLTRGFGALPAILITSLLFGSVHLANGAESLFGAANAILLGGVLAWSIVRSGSLWWAIGFHAAWNWAQSFAVGTADSGIRATGRLFDAVPQGTALWSGGAVGPEGSLLMILPIGMAAIAVLLFMPKAQLDDREPSSGTV